MSKKIFRFLRGELNGYYLTALTTLQNTVTDTVQKSLANYKAMKFDIDENLDIGTEFSTFSIIKGIGITAGVFVPYVDQDSNIASIKFTRSHMVNSVEYSERGLFSPEAEAFSFVTKDITGDINSLANDSLKTSMIETGAKPSGYIPEGVTVLDEDGNIDLSQIVFFTDPDNYEAELPTDKAYALYYGSKYLYLAESTPIVARLPNYMYIELVKQMQWIRNNGCSITSLCHLADILCHDFLFIFPEIKWYYGYAIVEYGIDEDVDAQEKMTYASLFTLIVAEKFPNINFTEISIKVTRDDEGNVISIEKKTGE